ncbi:MAG: hypothetical protein ACD_2C00156G0011 [uncultured bacterium (gcode 4)]|uniref:Alpha/beta hydrolase n=1 Tax=uncultured bacterium (gcode 4) TaxID=1234023 RepID=K2FEB8_9BACT|nr:MAG: hypothetical protein ACD_2C00156G0011 [uncultured bacterium (gcode 4)]
MNMPTSEIWIKNSRWQRLKAWMKNEQNSDIAIVYCHWFSWDSSNFTRSFAEHFWEKYLTCRFDFSGQWQSDWDFFDSSIDNELDDLKAVIDYLKANHSFKRLILQWHSFGVAISTIYWWKNHLDGFISLSWEWDLKEAINLEFNESQLSDFKEKWYAYYENWSKDWEMDKLWIQFLENMEKYSASEFIADIPCPGLFIHWTDDDVIPSEQTNNAFLKYIWNKDLHIIPWADHSYWFYSWNDRTWEIIKIIEEWIEAFN